MNWRKSCRIGYLATYLVVSIILGIIEVWGFLAPRFLEPSRLQKRFVDCLENACLFGSGK